MTAVALRASVLTAVKRAISDLFIGVKSSHLTEGIAAGLGFRTHAALLAFITARGDFPEYAVVEQGPFFNRLHELSYTEVVDDGSDWFRWIEIEESGGLKPIEHPRYEPTAPSARRRAHSAMLVAAFNEGIERKLFSLVPNDNRWEEDRFGQGQYPFRLGDYHGWAIISDAGMGELNLEAIVSERPMTEPPQYLKRGTGYVGAVAVTKSWLERDLGHWIQDSYIETHIQTAHLTPLSSIVVRPRGFSGYGRVTM